MKRILFYMVLAAACYAIATFFTEGQVAFIAVFGVGLLIGLMADLMFLIHLVRIARNRRKA